MKISRGFDFGRTYYIAGPMSGYPDHNYPAFEVAMGELQREAVTVASPHTIPWPEKKLQDEELWQAMMREALKLLLQCNGIILLKGWTASKGAMLEHQVASSLRMPAYLLDGKYLVSMQEDPTEVGDLLS